MNEQSLSHFYLSHGSWSEPGAFASALGEIPGSVEAIGDAIKGIMVHDYFGALLCSDPPMDMETASRATRPVAARLSKVHAIGQVPLTEARHTSLRRIGTCRDFALLTCSALRHHGIAARVRCGFARYFHPPTYEDHWICEYWDRSKATWKVIDTQLDEAHKRHLSIAFDANDVPPEEFRFPWQVWTDYRNDLQKLDSFGHGDATGAWFVRVNLARDFLALTKREVSAWDNWREHKQADKTLTRTAITQCDALATSTKLLATSPGFDPKDVDDLVTQLEQPHWQN